LDAAGGIMVLDVEMTLDAGGGVMALDVEMAFGRWW
jgi:hypothetical protein